MESGVARKSGVNGAFDGRVVVVIGAFGSVAVSGDGKRIAGHRWGVKFILPNNENIFEPIIQPSNHLNKNSIRKHLKSLPAASMRFPRLEHT